eukprot:RCo045193
MALRRSSQSAKGLWAKVRQDIGDSVAAEEAEMTRKCAQPRPENPFPAYRNPAVHPVRHPTDIPMRLQGAHPGDVIAFEEGTYVCNILLSQSGLTLKAAPGAKVVLTNDKASVLEISADYCRVEGLFITCTAEGCPAVAVTHGSAELLECDIIGA